MTKEELLAAIDAAVYQNNNKEITGEGLNTVLKQIVEECFGSDEGVSMLSIPMNSGFFGLGPDDAVPKETASSMLDITEEQFDAAISEGYELFKLVHPAVNVARNALTSENNGAFVVPLEYSVENGEIGITLYHMSNYIIGIFSTDDQTKFYGYIGGEIPQ